MDMGNSMRAFRDLKTTTVELLVALGNIVKACFRWFSKLHQNSLLVFWEVVILVLSKFSLNFPFWTYFLDDFCICMVLCTISYMRSWINKHFTYIHNYCVCYLVVDNIHVFLVHVMQTLIHGNAKTNTRFIQAFFFYHNILG